MAYLTRPDGRVLEVDDAAEITKLKNKLGFRDSTEDEISAYHAQKELARAQAKAEAAPDGVYYQTVSAGADGYGMSRDILKTELFRLGVKLEEHASSQKAGLLYSYPNGILQMTNDVRLIMTMFESDKIPEDWPDYLDMADEVIVPSKWCADTFARAGIKATVVPLGYNDRVFSYIDRPVPVKDGKPFTFIHYNSFNIRKGFFEVFEAFTKEFGSNEPVRLILKTTNRKPPIPIMWTEYPNVEVVTGELPEAELVKLLGRSNCMVYPSRGEGFGITPLEAMATGLPAIVPNAHGISEYFNANYMLEVKAEERCPGLYARFKGQDVGEMVICDVADLRRQMRHAYNNQAEMHELGRSASEYVKFYTYQKTAAKLAEIIQKWQRTDVGKRTDSKFLQVEEV
jgi:glycosyltransferase involved in cell wall biosynthesis